VEHPDCRLVVPTPPADNPKGVLAIRIDDVRTLEHWAALTPHEGPRKIFVVDDADRMTADTPHALLKTLEEPPPRTVLILILANARALPPTVLSRCQRVRFRPLAEGEVAGLLEARGVDPATARQRARVSGGQVGRALEADLAELDARAAAALALLQTPFVRQARLLDEASLDRDRGVVAGYLEVYWRLCRDALCVQAGADPTLLFEPDRPEAAELAARIPQATLVGALGGVKEAWLALEGHVSPRLCLERALIGLGSLGEPRGRAA
jgi:DNA polymerase-3 subunit delta'